MFVTLCAPFETYPMYYSPKRVEGPISHDIIVLKPICPAVDRTLDRYRDDVLLKAV